MISSVRGTVLSALGSAAVIDVGGIGLAIHVTPAHALSLSVGQPASIVTALIVREDSLSLFGFPDADHLEVFDLLRSVSGVGPKSAMGVLAALEPDEIASAVAAEDDKVFRKVSGIGPKTAKLIVVSLAGKLLAPVAAVGASVETPAVRGIGDSVLVALVGLGWSERVASDAVKEALAQADDAERATVSTLLRLALTRLGPNQVTGSRQ